MLIASLRGFFLQYKRDEGEEEGGQENELVMTGEIAEEENNIEQIVD